MAEYQENEYPEDVDLYISYIGVCSLLGRLSKYEKDEEEFYCIERALNDCIKKFPGRFEIVKVSGGGISLEPLK